MEKNTKVERTLARYDGEDRYALFERLAHEFKDEFIGNQGVADMLGIEAARVSRYRAQKERGEFDAWPEPFMVISNKIPVWLKSDVEQIRTLIEERRETFGWEGRRGGGPKKKKKRTADTRDPDVAIR